MFRKFWLDSELTIATSENPEQHGQVFRFTSNCLSRDQDIQEKAILAPGLQARKKRVGNCGGFVSTGQESQRMNIQLRVSGRACGHWFPTVPFCTPDSVGGSSGFAHRKSPSGGAANRMFLNV
jgi:hypothetical protein